MADTFAPGQDPFAEDIPAGQDPFAPTGRKVGDLTGTMAYDLARGAKHALDRAAYGLEGAVTGSITPQHQAELEAGKPSTVAGQVGRFAGDVALSAPLAARTAAMTVQALRGAPAIVRGAGLLAADAASGAAYGGLTTPEDRASGATAGAIGGAGGRVLGQTLGRVAGGIVRPTPSARTLTDAGVALTPGQASGAGSGLKRVEELATSNPITAAMVRPAQRRAVDDANTAAADAVARVVGQRIEMGTPPREAIAQVRDLVSQHYTQALAPLRVSRAALQSQLETALPGIAGKNPMMPEEGARLLARFATHRVGRLPQDVLTGQELKALDTELGEAIRALSSGGGADRLTAAAARDLQDQLRFLMERAAPDDATAQALTQANGAWRQLLALEGALPAGAPAFTPRQLARSLERRGITGQPINQLADAMQETLPNVVPDSGTPERLIGAAMMGGGGLATMGVPGLAAGLALGTRPGARALTGTLAGQQALADALRAWGVRSGTAAGLASREDTQP
jgi:hypothetical protein